MYSIARPQPEASLRSLSLSLWSLPVTLFPMVHRLLISLHILGLCCAHYV